jgi:hypothetical protein
LRGSAGLAPAIGGHAIEAVLLYEEHITSVGSSLQASGTAQPITLQGDQRMSALPLEADVYFRDGHVRFEPTRDIIFAQYVLTVLVPAQDDCPGVRSQNCRLATLRLSPCERAAAAARV